jgi:hypothetical protein
MDVLISQGGGTAIPGHELVSRVDARHVVHDAWCDVSTNDSLNTRIDLPKAKYETTQGVLSMN